MAIRLFDLFPGLAAAWPRDRVRFQTADFVVGPDEGAVLNRLTTLNHIVEVIDPRFGAEAGVAVEARLRVDNTLVADTELFLLALKAMPGVGFRLLNTDPIELPRLLVSQQDDGVELVVEGLPVQIELPAGFVHPIRADDQALDPAVVEQGRFFAGHLDTQRIVYRHDDPTTIEVHVRIVVDKDLDVVVVPAVPITFGPCAFSELPVKGAFDFHLIPSPAKARRWLPWLRHDVTNWFEGVVGDFEGAFAVRHLWLDPATGWLKRASDWLNEHGEKGDPTAEFVIDDLVVPFVIPLPRHATLGIRRSLEDAFDVGDVAAFDRAPVLVYFRREAPLGFLVNELFVLSQASFEDLAIDGLRLDVAFLFGRQAQEAEGEPDPQWSLGLKFVDEATLLLTGAHDLDDAGDTPGLDWKFGSTQISIVRAQTGVSIARLARGESFGSSFVLVLDILVKETDAGGDGDFPIQVKGLSGAPLEVLLEGIGWWFAPALEGAGFPGGVQIVFWNTFRILIEQIAVATRDNGGHYLVISAGLGLEWGEFVVRGLRFRLGGNPDAPRFGLDGFFGRIQGDTFLLEVGGYYDDHREGGLRIQELGFTGTLQVELQATTLTVALDLIVGRISGDENFRYFMVQVYVAFQFAVGPVQFLSFRALFANNMQPRLSPADEQSRELRYYQWYRRTDPTTVSGDRRLADWQAMEKAWGLGLGVGATFTGMGEIAKFRIFILGVDRPAGEGFLFAGEAFMLQGTEPVAYLVIEWDGEQDRFSALAGVDITIDKFINGTPSWLGNILSITGTLLVSTNPTIVALGRLRDPLTWFRLRIDVDLWLARSYTEVAFCFEVQTDPEDAGGAAMAIRMAGRGVVGPGLLEFYVGFGITTSTFGTGSQAYGAEIWAECGVRYRLFGFLNFGVRVGGEIHFVGPDPSFALFELFLEIETPWFLPDIELRIEKTDGRLEPRAMQTVTSPLRSASALVEATNDTAALFVAPAELLAMSPTDPDSGETNRPAVLSLDDVRAVVVPPRQTRVEAFRALGLSPVATDATVQVAFVVPVNDGIGLGVPLPARRTQSAGELSLTYDLVGLTVYRRPRWQPGAAWTPLVERLELAALLAGGGGLSGAFDPLPLTTFWEDTAVGSQSVAQRLLLNATTPFTFTLRDEAADESLIERNPDWPCCPRHRKPGRGMHVLNFQEAPLGDPVPSTLQFRATESVFRSLYPGLVRLSSFAGSGGIPLDTRAALYPITGSGVLFRVRFDEPVRWFDAHVGWLPAFSDGVLALVLSDEDGEVARQELPLRSSRAPAGVRLTGVRPGTECVAYAYVPPPPAPAGPGPGNVVVDPDAPVATTLPGATVEVDALAYLGWEAFVADETEQGLCGTAGDRGYAGDGKIGFLPNHEYEIALTTRVTVTHPAAGSEDAEFTQFVYFETKGLPGLNAAPRVGAEVEPYVAALYPAAGVLIYRREPIAVAFTEQLNVVVPLADRPAGPAAAERNVLMELTLAVQPDVAETPATLAGATAEDWIATHHTSPAPPDTRIGTYRWALTPAERMARTALSADPRRLRLANLVDRPGATCEVGDPRVAPSGVLLHPPLDAGTGTDPLWPPQARYTATVMVKDAPFVDRRPFQAGDQTALEYRGDQGVAAAAWSLAADGALESAGAGRRYAVFGEPDWDHVEIQAGLVVEGSAAGLVCAVPAGPDVHGWAALVEREGAAWFLALRRRSASGAAWDQVARVPLPAVAADGSTTLRLTVFDDRLRATVGDVQVEEVRGSQRGGRLGLFADGGVRVTSLLVRGLPMYRFPVQLSRYRDLAEHVGSFAGLDDVQPAVMGAPAAQTVAALLAATAADITAAMTREADAPVRQALFDRWTSGLGMPLRQTVERLCLSTYRPDGAVRALLLESPEPLRFTHEVSLTAERWYRERRPGRRPDVSIAEMTEHVLDLELKATAMADGPRLGFVRVEGDGRGGRTYRVYEGPVERRGQQARVRSDVTYVVDAASPRGRALGAKLAGARVGTMAVLDRWRDLVVDVFDPGRVVTVPVGFVVLTDSTQRNALLVPSAAVALAAGNYRLRFLIDRERWPDLSSGVPGQRLTQSAEVAFRI